MDKVAFILDEMFEDVEFSKPHQAVKDAGHQPVVIGIEAGKELEGKRGETKVKTELAISDADPSDYTALVIPGGYSPDKIRTDEDMVRFTKDIAGAGKPVAAICHAPWMLVEAGLAKDRTVTSWPSLKTDLINAGARWVDQEVVEDENIITSRKPDDLDAFSKALLAQMEQRS